jgi:hypothetical protein
MDKTIHIYVALISRITGFTAIDTQPKDFLENKAREKELEEQVKAQFNTMRGSRGLIIKEINDDMTRFAKKLIVFKILRKCLQKEYPAGVIAMET